MSKPWWDRPSVPEFREVAQRFIALIDGRDRLTATDLLHRAHFALPRLYSSGLALPVKPEEAYEEDDDTVLEYHEPDISLHQSLWRPIFGSLTTQIGPLWNCYQEVFDPYADPPEDVVTGSLADDLADIYVDLREGAQLWSRGLHDEAVWQWRFSFESHWGEHATGALRAIRALAFGHALGYSSTDVPELNERNDRQ
jgi:hypothetical protein